VHREFFRAYDLNRIEPERNLLLRIDRGAGTLIRRQPLTVAPNGGPFAAGLTETDDAIVVVIVSGGRVVASDVVPAPLHYVASMVADLLAVLNR